MLTQVDYFCQMAEIPLDRRQLAKRLKDVRKERKMSAQEVADKLGIGVKAFYHWESGTAMPDLMQFKALARIYRASADVLLFGSSFVFVTEELEMKLHALDGREALKVENIVRASLDMNPLPALPSPRSGETR